jgi:hypothetical protein
MMVMMCMNDDIDRVDVLRPFAGGRPDLNVGPTASNNENCKCARCEDSPAQQRGVYACVIGWDTYTFRLCVLLKWCKKIVWERRKRKRAPKSINAKVPYRALNQSPCSSQLSRHLGTPNKSKTLSTSRRYGYLLGSTTTSLSELRRLSPLHIALTPRATV